MILSTIKPYSILLPLALLLSTSFATAQVKDFTAVTDEMLTSPPAGEWLSWRGTPAAWGYSPLDQINTENVNQLQLKWSFALDDTGAVQAAPLIHDGIMFIPSARGVIQALDAVNGDLLWEYRPAPPTEEFINSGEGTRAAVLPPGAFAGVGRGVQKNIALYGDMIYAATETASIRAIDARSGLLVWETQVADPTLGYF